ncbi:hypothetical protein BKA70DRAFT_1494242 [Coprinopsis sp. MPI-PUGE-AT-0042]|nr:hypothetical protein BKA70DRAFT_1494242 [Coprinopsis sp. MPI-PUGE-AT-0042]
MPAKPSTAASKAPATSAPAANPRTTRSQGQKPALPQGSKVQTQAKKTANAKAKVQTKISAKAETEANKKAVQKRIAELEDEIHSEDTHRKQHAARPDLAKKGGTPVVPTQLPTTTLKLKVPGRASSRKVVLEDDPEEEDHQLNLEDNTDANAYGMSDPDGPEDSEFDVDSDAHGFSTDDAGEADCDEVDEEDIAEAAQDVDLEMEVVESENDDDDDMYIEETQLVEDSDSELELEVVVPPKKAKVAVNKAQRGDLRAAINATRITKPLAVNEQGAASLKRKLQAETERKQDSAHDADLDQGADKRIKRQEPPSGLLGGFKRQLKASRELVVKAPAAPEVENDLEYAGGEFDEDEAPSVVQAVRNGKGAAPAGFGLKSDVTITEQVVPPVSTGRASTKNWTVRELPFEGSRANVLKWRSIYKGTVIFWSATLTDPFGSNSHPDFRPMLQNRWSIHYPLDVIGRPLRRQRTTLRGTGTK